MNSDRPVVLSELCLAEVSEDCDVHVAECVNADGHTSFWILADSDEDQAPVRIPDHEQLGPLPGRVVRRLEALPTAGRCNVQTRAGTPCRKSATGCPFHRTNQP